MADGSVEATTVTKVEIWCERIAEHVGSGLSVKEFCKARGFTAWSFYSWRKRLLDTGPVRFALVERGPVRQQPAQDAQLEVVLASGERLRIGGAVEAATLRMVLDALRG
jgi:hypothetical protein